MKQTFYERIGESVYREVLPNGLQVCVVPKPEHAKKYAFFATRYGGSPTTGRKSSAETETADSAGAFSSSAAFHKNRPKQSISAAKTNSKPCKNRFLVLQRCVLRLLCLFTGLR